MALYGLDSDFFCVGFVTDAEGFVTEAPPIIRYTKGWTLDRITQYAMRRGWTLYLMKDEETPCSAQHAGRYPCVLPEDHEGDHQGVRLGWCRKERCYESARITWAQEEKV